MYFDDLKISHAKSNILQEDHYYPFGMNMHGLSSSASLAKPNAYKFNGGTELTADFGWQMYDTPFRSYDAQLGRFHQVDPLADQAPGINPYRFGFNNPISLNDPTGLYEGSIQDIFDEAWARTPGDVGFFHFDNGKLDRDLWAEGAINHVVDFITSGEVGEFMLDASGGGGYWIDYRSRTTVMTIGMTTYLDIESKRPKFISFSRLNTEEFLGGVSRIIATMGTGWSVYSESRNRFPTNFESPNGKIRPVRRPGGKYYSKAARAFDMRNARWINTVKNVGYGFAGVGIAVDIVGLNNYYNSNNPNAFIVTPSKFGLNLAMTTVGLVGGPFLMPVAGFYFLIDATVGWDNALSNMKQIDDVHKRVTGKSFTSERI